jgi:hypothetical protein
MKCQALIPLSVAVLLLLPFAGRSVTPDNNTTTPLQPQPAINSTAQLSGAAAEVAKMAAAGVPEDVVRAYVENSTGTFNLSAENIIHLHDLGVSGAVTAAMLNHDRAMIERANVMAPPPPQGPQPAPAVQAPAPAYTTAQTPSDSDVYNNLSPYGSWYDMPGYGWSWQPYGWVGYNSWPWWWLGYGSWWNCPGRGWCWFPRSHFVGFRPFGFRAGVGFAGGRGFGTAGVSTRTGGFGFVTTGGAVGVSARTGGFGFVAPRASVSGWSGGSVSRGFHVSGGGFHGGGHGGHR